MSQSRKMLALIFDLSKVTRCCQREWTLCEGLTFLQFYILDLISTKGPMELYNLHTALSVEKSTTTRLIEPLLKQELINREKSNEDSRVIIVSLTEKGVQIHQNAWKCIDSYLGKMDSAIPSDKKDQVYDSVRLFLKILQNPCDAIMGQ